MTELFGHLLEIAAYGTRRKAVSGAVLDVKVEDNWITCRDGFKLSVVAGPWLYCTPRPGMTADDTYNGPYTHVEVGFPSDVPEPEELWEEYAEDWSRPTKTVYPYVPVEMVQDLINWHGGERESK